jgi:hypothetical protein
VRKVEPRQYLDIGAHLARIARTLPESRESPRKTRPRPRRTLPAFILPSFGWFLRVSPIRTLFFAGLHPLTPKREFSLTGMRTPLPHDYRHDRSNLNADGSASFARLIAGMMAGHCGCPVVESTANKPSD